MVFNNSYIMKQWYKDKVLPVNNAWNFRNVCTKKSYSFISRSKKNKFFREKKIIKNIFLFFSHKLSNPLTSTGMEMKLVNAVTGLQCHYVHWVPGTSMHVTVINLIINLLRRLRFSLDTYGCAIIMAICDSNKESFALPKSFKGQRMN